jgi:hypothetical protein
MERQNTHVVIGAALFLVLALAITLVYVSSQAETTQNATTTANIVNTAPTVETVSIADGANGASQYNDSTGITLVPGTTKTVHINGVVRDANGYADINDVTMTFYRSSVANAQTCTADNNNCYRVTTCTLGGGSGADLTQTYDCSIDLSYYTDASGSGTRYPSDHWAVYVKVTDKEPTTGISNDQNTGNYVGQTNINRLLALTIPAAIDYSSGGNFGLGATTTNANNQEMTITQQGNDEADVQVSGTTMACDNIGSILVGQQKWALTDVGYSNGSTTALTGSLVNTILDVHHQDLDGSSNTSKVLYWNIGIPSTGVKGLCTGTNTITAIAHADQTEN